MAETKRVPVRAAQLDVASDQMAEVLRRADALLLEWAQFGAAVRAQVEREANRIGGAVGDAVELAAERAAGAAVERAITDRLGTQLAAISVEVGKLETRARAASRAIAEHKRRDRGILIGLVVAVVIANGLLIALLLRKPDPVVMMPAPEPVPVVPRASASEPPPSAPAQAIDENAARPEATPVEAKPAPEPVAKPADPKTTPKPTPAVRPLAEPAHKPVKQGPPTGSRRP